MIQPNAPHLDRWLNARRRGVLLVLVGAALVVRVIYVLQLAGGPCLWQHRWEQTDMNFFHNWALTIASGDWLTDRPLHPYHLWHHRVADDYLRGHPEMIDSYTRDAAAAGITAPQLLWQQWYGGKRLHQEPLYPYLLAATYKLFGADVRAAFAWQLLLGVGSVVLIHLLARDLFGDTVGAVAGVMAVLCAPLLFYDLVLVRATALTFVGLGAVYATIRALEADSWKWWLTTGLALGLAILLKGTFLL